jgi:hypothetical protein
VDFFSKHHCSNVLILLEQKIDKRFFGGCKGDNEQRLKKGKLIIIFQDSLKQFNSQRLISMSGKSLRIAKGQ